MLSTIGYRDLWEHIDDMRDQVKTGTTIARIDSGLVFIIMGTGISSYNHMNSGLPDRHVDGSAHIKVRRVIILDVMSSLGWNSLQE